MSAAASAGPLSSRPPGSPRAGVAVAAAPEASQVLGAGVALEPASARLAALHDPGFLAEAGWGPASRVLSLAGMKVPSNVSKNGTFDGLLRNTGQTLRSA